MNFYFFNIKNYNMKFLFSVFSVFICSAYLFGQQPEIVVDFNSGSDNSFSEWNYKAITLNNIILLPLISTEFGEELGIVKKGDLRILKGILLLKVGIMERTRKF